jgi:hypothetical protein
MSAKEACPAIFVRVGGPGAAGERESGSTSSSAFVFGPHRRVLLLLGCASSKSGRCRFAVVLTVRSPCSGALLLTWIVGLENDVYFPGRARHARRLSREERDPDLRVRDSSAFTRHGARAKPAIEAARGCACARS